MSGVRLRHVAQINPLTPEFDRLADDQDVTFVPLEAVWPGTGLNISQTRPKAQVSNGYTRFRENDVLVPKITPTFEANRTTVARGLLGGLGAGTTELHVVRPGPNLDARYANYLLASRPFLQGGKAVMKGVAGQQRVPDEWLRGFRVPVDELAKQRAIADFLDAETARIDALIEKKRGLRELLRRRREGHIEHAIRGLVAEWGEAPLKYLARSVTVGIVVTPAAWYAEAGVPALRGQNVKPGRIVLDDLVYLTDEGHALHRKSELRSGDVVVVRTGQAGAATVVPPRVAGANCVDLIIVRPGPSADAKFLEHVLNSDWTRKHVERYSVGTIQSHFNVSAMKAVPVPSAPIRRQREVVASLGKLTARVDSTVARLDRQIDLLAEHRQALITAAVTGQLKVPGVAA